MQMATRKRKTNSSVYGNFDGSSKGFEDRDQLQYDQKFSLSPSPNESLIEKRDRNYKDVDACDQLLCDRRYSLSSNDDPLIENRDDRHPVHEVYLHPRVLYKRELDRDRYNIWRKSPDVDHKCRDCGSRRCNRGSECSRLHQDVNRDKFSWLDDIHLNDFQLKAGRFESRRRYESGRYNWNLTIDKGHEEYQQRSGRYIHDVAGRYHQAHMTYALADRGGRLSLSIDNPSAKDGYSYSADISHSNSSRHQYKRCIRADGLFKRRRTEATWRREDSCCFEEDGRRSISRGGHLQSSSDDQSWDARRGNETVAENSSLLKTSNEPLNTLDKGVSGWQTRKIGCAVSGNDNESFDSRSESSDVNFNSCTRSREMHNSNEKQLTAKHSRKYSSHRGSPLRNKKMRAIQKHYSVKRKTPYYPDHKRLHLEDKATVLCKYYLKGFCGRGNRCWFSHGTDSSKARLDLNEKISVIEHTSVANSEISPGHDLSSTNNSNRLLQKSDRSSGLIEKSMPVKSTAVQKDTTKRRAETFSVTKSMPESTEHTQTARGKKCPETSVGKKIAPGRAMRQKCVDNDNHDGKGDDGCENYLVEGTDENDSSVEQMVEKELFADPSLLIPHNTVPEIPSLNPDSCVEVGKSKESLMGNHVSDQADPLSSTHEQHICMLNKHGTSYESNRPCSPCSCQEDLDGVLDKNGVDLNSQFLSGGPEVNVSQNSIISNGFVEFSSVQRTIADTSVGKPPGHQPWLQEGFPSMEEQGNCVYGDESVSSLMSKKPSSCPTASRSVNSCNDNVAGMENFQESLAHDVFVSDDSVCGIQQRNGNNEHINNGLFTASCGEHSTRASTDQVPEEMLVCGTIPLPSDSNSPACFQLPAIEEAEFGGIGFDPSLDHYIYKTLSLEHYVSHMEDENKATTSQCTYKEQIPFLEDITVAITSENIIEGSNVELPLPSDGISETKPVCSFGLSTSLSPTRVPSNDGEEITWEPIFEQHDNITTKKQEERPVIKLEPIGLRNTFAEETFPHVNKEPSSSQNEGTFSTVHGSSDKHVDSLSVAEPIKTISGLGSSFKANISKELGTIMSGFHSNRYESFASEQNQQVLIPKEPAAVFEANGKNSFKVDSDEEVRKSSCDGSRDVGCKCKDEEDEKLLLRVAVLQLAKSILSPLWEAGRIKSKEIYKSITQKVVKKVSDSVQGVNIPRTKESVDHYLLHHKPRIAQLVLAYVNMYPVSL